MLSEICHTVGQYAACIHELDSVRHVTNVLTDGYTQPVLGLAV